jgi:hypothetical protein
MAEKIFPRTISSHIQQLRPMTIDRDLSPRTVSPQGKSRRVAPWRMPLFAAAALAGLGFANLASAQTLLYQWNFNGNSLNPTATGGGASGGALTITNAGTATSGVIASGGVTGSMGDDALNLTSTTYNSTAATTTVVGTLTSVPTLTAMTATAWVRAEDWSLLAGQSNARILELNSAASGFDGDKFYFALNASTTAGNPLQVGINTPGTGTINNAALLPNSGSSWVFVAMTWDSALASGSNVSTYIGSASGAATQSGTPFGAYTTPITGVTAVSIGNRNNGTPTRNFDGFMDDVRVYSGALSAAQIEGVRLSAVPEPTALSLLLLSAVGSIGLRRRRQVA